MHLQVENPRDNFISTAFNNVVQKLAAKFSDNKPLNEMSAAELIGYFIEDIDEIKITYHAVQEKIVELL